MASPFLEVPHTTEAIALVTREAEFAD